MIQFLKFRVKNVLVFFDLIFKCTDQMRLENEALVNVYINFKKIIYNFRDLWANITHSLSLVAS